MVKFTFNFQIKNPAQNHIFEQILRPQKILKNDIWPSLALKTENFHPAQNLKASP